MKTPEWLRRKPTPPEQYAQFNTDELGESLDLRYAAEHTASKPRHWHRHDSAAYFLQVAQQLEHIDEGILGALKPIVEAHYHGLGNEQVEFGQRRAEYTALIEMQARARVVLHGTVLNQVRAAIAEAAAKAGVIDAALAPAPADYTPGLPTLPDQMTERKRKESQ